MASHRYQSGNAIVEFAVSLPFLIVVMLGIAELGRYAYTALLVSNAARAGAQYGSQSIEKSTDTTGMTNAAKANGTHIPIKTPTYTPGSVTNYCWDSSTGAETSNGASTTCATGTLVQYVSYTVTGDLTPLFRFPKLPKNLHVTSTATLRVCRLC